MEAIYNIDFTKLIRWLTPPKLRGAIMLNWLKSLVSPVNYIYNNFMRYRADVAYRLNITPQVCYLEKVLNDTFDNTDRRIFIQDNLDFTIILIHKDEAQLPVMIHQEGSIYEPDIPIIHDASAYGNSGYDFSVIVPVALSASDDLRLKTILNFYKLPGKRYQILYT